MAVFLLGIAIVSSVLAWPIMRWGSQGNSNSVVLGFWMSTTIAAGSTLLLLSFGSPVYSLELWICGLLLGFAYAIGFAGLICYCQQIGPIGPTATINNMAKIFSVLYAVLYLDPHVPNAFILLGLAGGFLAVILLSLSSTSSSANAVRPITKRWLVLVLIGGLLSGVSLTVQTHVGVRFPGFDNALTFMSVGFVSSSLILLPRVYGLSPWSRTHEMKAGLLVGACSLAAIWSTLFSFSSLTPEIVFPIVVTVPLVATMLLGRFFYHEKLGTKASLGCVLALISLALLSYGSAP